LRRAAHASYDRRLNGLPPLSRRQPDGRPLLSALRHLAGGGRYAWRILASLAEIAGRRADASRAQTLLCQSREIIDHIASHAGRPELRETFLDSPAARAVLARSG